MKGVESSLITDYTLKVSQILCTYVFWEILSEFVFCAVKWTESTKRDH